MALFKFVEINKSKNKLSYQNIEFNPVTKLNICSTCLASYKKKKTEIDYFHHHKSYNSEHTYEEHYVLPLTINTMICYVSYTIICRKVR